MKTSGRQNYQVMWDVVLTKEKRLQDVSRTYAFGHGDVRSTSLFTFLRRVAYVQVEREVLENLYLTSIRRHTNHIPTF